MLLHSDEAQVFPHQVEQFIEIPFQVARDGDVVGDLVDDVELFQSQLIDLVERIDTRNVNSLQEFVCHNVNNDTIIYQHTYLSNFKGQKNTLW